MLLQLGDLLPSGGYRMLEDQDLGGRIGGTIDLTADVVQIGNESVDAGLEGGLLLEKSIQHRVVGVGAGVETELQGRAGCRQEKNDQEDEKRSFGIHFE